MMGAAALLLLVPGLFGRPTSTAVQDLPHWAEEIARSAPAPAAERDGPDARVLLAETQVEVQPDGSTLVREHRAVQVLRTPAPWAGRHAFYVARDFHVRLCRAFHVPIAPTRREEAVTSFEVVGDFSSFTTDVRQRQLGVDDVRAGSLVFFEFEALGPQPTLDLENDFGDAYPRSLSRYRIDLPPGWNLRYEWLRIAGPEPERTERAWTWTLRDLEHPRPLPLAADPDDLEPILAVTLLPSSRPGQSAVLDTWSSMGTWYEELERGRAAVTPAVRAMADRACPASVTEPWAQIEALARYARDGVRYIAREIGIGALQPRPASATAADLVGDCKDKGTLLRALLAAKNIRAYAVHVHASERDTVPERVPAIGAFNHFVVAVHVPEGATLPESVRAATFDGGTLGRLLIVDVTHEALFPGAASADLGGKRALLHDGAQSRLVTLPDGGSGAHRIARSLEIEVAGADATWIQVSRFVGEPATRRRGEHQRDPAAARRKVQASLDDRWPGATLKEYTVTEELPDGSYEETSSWTTPAADVAASPFPFLDADLPRTSLGKRTRPVLYPHPLSLRYAVRVHGDPEPPSPLAKEASGSGWTVERTWREDSGVRIGTLDATLEKTTFGPEEFETLRKFWAALAAKR
ncbi:MAG TPA: DUF3857 domain-containing protein [Candidatus Polarisedimenticolaceae bacterium]|nr:DUF3857 domain-containing protein [Candidatus Polarisedimenticolaceae bacterium]